MLIADEPVSALDASVQAQILNLLMELREREKITLVLISHDLHVVRHLCDRIAVMYLGEIVELRRTAELFAAPLHPYTKLLLAALPDIHAPRPLPAPTESELPDPFTILPGCRFAPRCPLAELRCETPQVLLRAPGAQPGDPALARCWKAAPPTSSQ